MEGGNGRKAKCLKKINLMKDVFTLTYRIDRQEKDIEKIQKQLNDFGDEVS
jgi:hypothetical protein